MLSWRRKRSAAREARKKRELELTIPSNFQCPISLELMKDPVTLSTGITYDRDNIEKWIEAGNRTCPKTNQILRGILEPVPNHTLRKLIQEWCVENKSYGIERIPTPRVPVSSYEVKEILARVEASRNQKDGEGCRELVAKIKAKAKESERNKRCFLANGTTRVLSAAFEAFSESKAAFEKSTAVLEEILSTLATMSQHDIEANSVLGSMASLSSMAWLLRSGSLSTRRNVVLVLIEIVTTDHARVDDLVHIEGFVEALVKLIEEPICPTTTKASLLLLYSLVSRSSSANDQKIKARLANMGLVELILEILVDSEKSVSEKALGVLNEICSCTEGRRRTYSNALAVPVLVKKILRVSDLVTEFSVSILWKIGTNEEREEEAGDVLIHALQLGAFQKLLLVIQVGCAEKTKEKASDLLKLLNLYRGKAECVDSLDFKNLKRSFE